MQAHFASSIRKVLKMNLLDLSAPFDPDEIDWRVGATTKDKSKGIALAYIDARAVMERLDSVCGPENWQCKYSHAGEKTVCEILIKCGEEWVAKSNGAGDTDVEGPKGALSDAFKRAAVVWGVGRYLYSLDSPWVRLEARGRSYVIAKDELPRLKGMLGGRVKTDTKTLAILVETIVGDVEKNLKSCGSLEELKDVWVSSSVNLKKVMDFDKGQHEALVKTKDQMKNALTKKEV